MHVNQLTCQRQPLIGGSYESYVRSILAAACMPKSEGGLGYRGVVINCRGCEFRSNTIFLYQQLTPSQVQMCPLHLLRYLESSTKLPILDVHNLCSLLFFKFYSGGPTDDLRCGLLYLSQKYPNAPLVGLGFSLGANILTRYLGEEGTRSRLIAGIALACVSTSPNH